MTKRFYPARFHDKGPGAWGLIDQEREGLIANTCGKTQAYLLAELLNTHGIPEGWENAFALMFEKRDKDNVSGENR